MTQLGHRLKRHSQTCLKLNGAHRHQSNALPQSLFQRPQNQVGIPVSACERPEAQLKLKHPRRLLPGRHVRWKLSIEQQNCLSRSPRD
jgi:hypothetical protein